MSQPSRDDIVREVQAAKLGKGIKVPRWRKKPKTPPKKKDGSDKPFEDVLGPPPGKKKPTDPNQPTKKPGPDDSPGGDQPNQPKRDPNKDKDTDDIPVPPEGNDKVKDFFNQFGDELLGLAGMAALLGFHSNDDDDEEGGLPQHPPEGESCMLVHPDWKHPDLETLEPITVLPIAAAALGVPPAGPGQFAASSATGAAGAGVPAPQKLNPLPTFDPVSGRPAEYFRTAAGECRKWFPEEAAVIKQALKKRKQMKEAYMRKYGCKTPKRVCYTIGRNGRHKKCSC